MKEKSLAKNSLYSVIYQVLSLAFPLVTSMYVARVLSVDGIGKVAIAQNLVSYFTSFAPLGIPTYGIREIAKQKNNSLEKNRVYTELFLINLISTSICTVVYLGIMFNFEPYSNNISLCLACGLTLFFNFINIEWLYKGEEDYGYITARSLIVKILSLGCMFLFVRTKDDFVIYALITSLANGLNYIFNLFHSRKIVRFEFHGLKLSRHMKSLMILLFSIILSSVYSKIDITTLGILSTETSVGYYQYVFKIVEMLIAVCTAVTTVFLPRLSFLYLKDKKLFMSTLSFGVECLIFFSVPMATGVFLLADDILVLFFGQDFAPATLSLRIMSLLIIIRGLGDLLSYQLPICTGNEAKRLPAHAIAAVMNIIMNIVLIPRFAHNGAAVATVISELIVNSVIFLSIRKEFHIIIKSKAIIQVLVSTLLMCIVVLLCRRALSNLILETVISILAGITTYMAVNLLLRNQIILAVINKIRNSRMK